MQRSAEMSTSRTRYVSVLIALVGLLLSNTAFSAALRCDNCSTSQYQAKASAAGAGTHIIADYSQRKVVAYSVEYDRELRVWRTLPATVPASIKTAFERDMALAYASSSATPRASASGGSVVVIGPGRSGFPFPAGFNDANTYDIVGSSNLRTQLEQQIAASAAGATTGSSIWDSLAFALRSLSLSFLGQKIGVSSVTYVIIWKDGSKTVLKVEAGASHRAKYQPGESVDAEGNKVPDAAATDPATGPSYAGQYYFENNSNLEEWLNAARMHGIPVTRGGSAQLSCSWKGTTLTCMYRSY
jgi:hypothetical protein